MQPFNSVQLSELCKRTLITNTSYTLTFFSLLTSLDFYTGLRFYIATQAVGISSQLFCWSLNINNYISFWYMACLSRVVSRFTSLHLSFTSACIFHFVWSYRSLAWLWSCICTIVFNLLYLIFQHGCDDLYVSISYTFLTSKLTKFIYNISSFTKLQLNWFFLCCSL